MKPFGAWMSEMADDLREPAAESPSFEVRESAHMAVLRIDEAGRLFWREREVTTDDELRASLREISAMLVSMSSPVEPLDLDLEDVSETMWGQWTTTPDRVGYNLDDGQ